MTLRNPLGPLALEATQGTIRLFMSRISAALTLLSFDAGSRLRVQFDTASNLTNVTTVGNVAAQGGYNNQFALLDQTMGGANYLRNRIKIT